jgi:hypothetical protein
MKKQLLLIFSLLLGQILLAQNRSQTVTVNYQNANINQVVTDLQTQTGYKFYYDPAQFDSLRVNLQLNARPFDTVLSRIFSGTKFYYATINNLVFLTRDRAIKIDLATGYSIDDKAKPTNAATAIKETATEYTFSEKKPEEATIENKVYEIGIRTTTFKAGKAILTGYVHDAKSGEPVIGATVYSVESKIGVTADQFGYYTIGLPYGKQTLLIRAIGQRDMRRQLVIYGDGKLNFDMQQQVTSLKEVKISAEKIANVRSVEMGVNKLDIASIKQVPTVFGEADVLRVVLTLPGVQTVGEASTGFNVRGGSADQNLIMLNGATIYNPSHFFGFFSAFAPDIVKDIELYKSSIPERFGGRLASVLDVTNRDGNNKKYTGSAGIGLLTSRLNVEGPIDSGRTSFIFSGRTTYANWLLNLLPEEYKHSRATFYDFNFDITHKINEKNDLYLTTYLSHDYFKLNSDTGYNYGNKNIVLKWKHNFSSKLYAVFSGGYDFYNYDITSEVNQVNAYKLNFDIGQANLKTDFNYYLSTKHTLNFGLSSIRYRLNPGTYSPEGDLSLVKYDKVPTEQALESALYLGDKWDVTPNLSLNFGIRYSIYNYLGPQTINNYAPGLPVTTLNLVDTTRFASGKFIKTYQGPEIRASARYSFGDNYSIKASYNTLRQYLHQLSNTTAISPVDVYKLSDPNIKPQYGSQVSLGLYHNLKNNTIETSIEVYYKQLKDYLDYRSGAVLLLNHHIETDVLSTKGKAYGAEFLIKKNAGMLNGWMSYTYSRILLKQDDPNAGELINGGNYYPANYDKPHSFNFTGNYRVSHRFSMSLNVVYSTGRPITLPIAKYFYAGSERVYYADRNTNRIPDYFRSDFSMNIEGNHKVHQKFHNSWTVGIYNLTGRKNAYSTFFTEQGGVVSGYKLSIFANPIPFVNYNIRF